MKCPVCSHVFSDTQSRCSRCGRVVPASDAKSTLIEFPATRQARTSLPDWRVELNEKVRAIKARRSMEALVDEAASLRQAALVMRAPVPAPPPEPEPEPEPANPIVAAALDRVRRASENAARVALQPASAAAAVQPAPVREAPAPRVVVPIAPIAPVAPAPMRIAQTPVVTAPARTALFDPAELLDGLEDDLDLLDDDEHSLPASGSATSAHRASLALRGVATLVDLALFCVVSVPFVATTYAIDGDFTRPSVVVLLASTLVLLGVFYLFTMFAICGRTVGMMFSRTHVVAVDGGAPSSRSVFLRVLGTLAALAPAGLGFAWALVHREGCGWHDLLSGTRVVED